MTTRLIAALEDLKRSGCVGDRVIHDGKGGRAAANFLHVWMATVLRRAKRPVVHETLDRADVYAAAGLPSRQTERERPPLVPAPV